MPSHPSLRKMFNLDPPDSPRRRTETFGSECTHSVINSNKPPHDVEPALPDYLLPVATTAAAVAVMHFKHHLMQTNALLADIANHVRTPASQSDTHQTLEWSFGCEARGREKDSKKSLLRVNALQSVFAHKSTWGTERCSGNSGHQSSCIDLECGDLLPLFRARSMKEHQPV